MIGAADGDSLYVLKANSKKTVGVSLISNVNSPDYVVDPSVVNVDNTMLWTASKDSDKYHFYNVDNKRYLDNDGNKDLQLEEEEDEARQWTVNVDDGTVSYNRKNGNTNYLTIDDEGAGLSTQKCKLIFFQLKYRTVNEYD